MEGALLQPPPQLKRGSRKTGDGGQIIQERGHETEHRSERDQGPEDLLSMALHGPDFLDPPGPLPGIAGLQPPRGSTDPVRPAGPAGAGLPEDPPAPLRGGLHGRVGDARLCRAHESRAGGSTGRPPDSSRRSRTRLCDPQGRRSFGSPAPRDGGRQGWSERTTGGQRREACGPQDGWCGWPRHGPVRGILRGRSSAGARRSRKSAAGRRPSSATGPGTGGGGPPGWRYAPAGLGVYPGAHPWSAAARILCHGPRDRRSQP